MKRAGIRRRIGKSARWPPGSGRFLGVGAPAAPAAGMKGKAMNDMSRRLGGSAGGAWKRSAIALLAAAALLPLCAHAAQDALEKEPGAEGKAAPTFGGLFESACVGQLKSSERFSGNAESLCACALKSAQERLGAKETEQAQAAWARLEAGRPATSQELKSAQSYADALSSPQAARDCYRAEMAKP